MSPAKRPLDGAEEDPKLSADAARAATAQRLLARAVRRARLSLTWERIWPGLALPLLVVGLFLAVSFAGLWPALPALGRVIGVAAFALLLLLSLIPLLRVRLPGDAEAVARLDRESALAHRPATTLSDRLATRPDDPVGAALWRAHLARAVTAAARLRAGLPAPGLAKRDPRGLRALVVLALFATFFMAPGAHLARIGAAFDWRALTPPTPFRLDAWVDPPAYTGRPPAVLPGLRWDEPTALNATALQVPAGSVLVVRGAGIDLDGLKLEGGITPLAPSAGDAGTAAEAPAAAREQRFVIHDTGDVSFVGPDQRRVMWHFKALPDLPPTVAFAREPKPGPRNVLQLAYRIEDDYGVKAGEVEMTPVPAEPPLFPRPGAAAPRVPEKPLVPAPEVKLVLPPGGRSGAAQTSADLVAHPWAGATVKLTLKVRDDAGNEGRSETRQVRLPARSFSNPMARALIDERRLLAFDARNRRRLVAVLTALTDTPEAFAPPLGQYLGLRAALAQAKYARNDDDLRALVDYLWEMAVQIEDGTLTDAERALKAAQEALREALERGASDEEIQRLTQDLRAAMDKMMRQLAEQSRRDSGTDARPLDPNTRIVRPQDLQRMLDQIENLARSGNREAAQQLLEQLQAMMENMRPGNRQAGRQGNRQQSELGAMIQEQQRLRDRTYRQGRESGREQQGAEGGSQEGGPQEGGPQEGEADRQGRFDELRQGQQELRQRLGRMRDALREMQRGQQGQQGENGEPQGQGDGQGEGQAQAQAMDRAGEALSRAEQAMREAEEALGRGEGQTALDAEGRALQSLRQGAQALAQGQRGNQNGEPGPGGPGEDSAQRTDPLGRPLRGQDYGDDFTVKVPDEVDAQRARQVLEELRRRLEQPGRPRLELDYLERLLNGL
ncbi:MULTISPECIES: TIGR02302 family protein [unclassified Xanthobacter]|uniref:TIGR02302 family protein n=1 Tax=unclassified Xanthobacter TaxID=2623496 RepID=UPI001EE015B6